MVLYHDNTGHISTYRDAQNSSPPPKNVTHQSGNDNLILHLSLWHIIPISMCITTFHKITCAPSLPEKEVTIKDFGDKDCQRHFALQ